MKKDLVIRMKERLRVYRDSPGVTVTYVDLAHLIEDVIEMGHDKNDNSIGYKAGIGLNGVGTSEKI